MLTLASLILVATAPAPQSSDTRTVAVTHHDLDLATPRGQAELDRRMKRAAANACPNPGYTDAATAHRIRACVATALQQAAPTRERLAAQAKPHPIAIAGTR